MNDFSNIPAESEFRDEATLDCREIEPGLTPEEITEQQLAREEALDDTPLGIEYGGYDEPYDGGWPGDGSGMDDLADFNQNEAMDYYGD